VNDVLAGPQPGGEGSLRRRWSSFRRDIRHRLSSARGPFVALGLYLVMFTVFVSEHPAGFSRNIVNTAANKGALLALVAVAQTIPVLSSGLDLSVGMVFVLTNCLASTLVSGGALSIALGVAAVLGTGLLCGALNGALVVRGRLQPIIATLATGSIYFGCALWLRPAPGGTIDDDFAEFVTGSLPGGIPVTVVLLLAIVLLGWVPYRRSVIGRAAYAVGSSEQAAFMSGLPIASAKFLCYVLAGFFSAIAGLLLTCLTESGEANSVLGGSYTLSSIAAVVVGGTSLFGGSGGAVGSIFGAFVLRTIGDLLFVFNLDPLWQPLFLGVVLLVSVGVGSLRLLRVKNRLDLFR
jgi:ribose transport system permease protein